MAMRVDGGTRLRVAVVSTVVLALAMLATSCGGAVSTGSSPVTTASDQLEGIHRDRPLEVGAVTLPEVAPGRPDEPFTMKARPGGVLFVYFGYTNCPDLCPTTLSDLRQALEKLGGDADRVDVAFVTVDHERDTPDVIAPYLAAFIKNGHEHPIRTTSDADLKAAEAAFLASSTVTKGADGSYEVAHTATSTIVDERGTVLVEWPFGISPDSMAHDLRIVLATVAGYPPSTQPPSATTSPASPTPGA